MNKKAKANILKKALFTSLTFFISTATGLLLGMQNYTWQQDQENKETSLLLRCCNDQYRISKNKFKKIKVLADVLEDNILINEKKQSEQEEEPLSVDSLILTSASKDSNELTIPGFTENTEEAQRIFRTFLDLLHQQIRPQDLSKQELLRQTRLADKFNCKSVLQLCCRCLVDKFPNTYKPTTVHALLESYRKRLPDGVIDYAFVPAFSLKYSKQIASFLGNPRPIITKDYPRCFISTTHNNCVTFNDNEVAVLNKNCSRIVKVNPEQKTACTLYTTTPDTIKDLIKINDEEIAFLSPNEDDCVCLHILNHQTNSLTVLETPHLKNCFEVDENTLVTVSKDSDITLWDKQTIMPTQTIHCEEQFIENIQKWDKHHLLLLADSKLFELNTETQDLIQLTEEDVSAVIPLNAHVLIYGTKDGDIVMFNKETNSIEGRWNIENNKIITDLFLLNKRILLYNARSEQKFGLWNIVKQHNIFTCDKMYQSFDRAFKIKKNHWLTMQTDNKKNRTNITFWKYETPYTFLTPQIKKLLDLQYQRIQRKRPITLDAELENFFTQIDPTNTLLNKAKKIELITAGSSTE